MMRPRPFQRLFAVLPCLLGALACSSDEAPEAEQPAPFELRFAAMVDGKAVGCTDQLSGFGPAGTHRIGINDLRFYVSNLKLRNKDGAEVPVTLDTNELQLASAEGNVALVDLTGNTDGSCGPTSVANAEGTARTHLALTGTTLVGQVASVSFDVGVPQPLMKKTIAATTPEGAPSPLNEMYWSWNSGYRHFVFNFGVQDPQRATGAGYVHLGSRDCAPGDDGLKALSDRDACTFVNTPAVTIPSFDLRTDTVGIDLRKVLAGIDFVSPIRDPATFETIGEGPGAECHSSPMQADCASVFPSFGLSMASGAADAAADVVFVKMP